MPDFNISFAEFCNCLQFAWRLSDRYELLVKIAMEILATAF